MARHLSPTELWLAVARPQPDREVAGAETCPSCGAIWDEVYATGLAACPDCYEAFRPRIERYRAWQKPQPSAGPGVLLALRRREETRAADHEDYETAAWLGRLTEPSGKTD